MQENFLKGYIEERAVKMAQYIVVVTIQNVLGVRHRFVGKIFQQSVLFFCLAAWLRGHAVNIEKR